MIAADSSAALGWPTVPEHMGDGACGQCDSANRRTPPERHSHARLLNPDKLSLMHEPPRPRGLCDPTKLEIDAPPDDEGQLYPALAPDDSPLSAISSR